MDMAVVVHYKQMNAASARHSLTLTHHFLISGVTTQCATAVLCDISGHLNIIVGCQTAGFDNV